MPKPDPKPISDSQTLPHPPAPITNIWEVLTSATGTGLSLRAFEAMLDRIELRP